MSINCEKCGKVMDPLKAKKEIRLISMDPELAVLETTCEHCDHVQQLAVMDGEQIEAFKKLKALNRKIAVARHRGFRRKAIRILENERKELTAFLEERSEHLMEMYEISQKLTDPEK